MLLIGTIQWHIFLIIIHFKGEKFNTELIISQNAKLKLLKYKGCLLLFVARDSMYFTFDKFFGIKYALQ